MRPKSLKGKLLIAVSALVIGSGILISLLVTHRYSKSLLLAMTAQAENVAHAVALQAADQILINDLISLQKMLYHHRRSNPAVAYLFVSRDGHILAHTFEKGVPSELIGANFTVSDDKAHLQKISSTTGERYLDIAYPIFEGKGGILRLGFSEAPYRERLNRLWVEMGAFTLGILLLALMGALFFVRRITRPLASLTLATQRIDAGHLGVRVSDVKDDEVGLLASSFNRMVARIEEYTTRLEDQTMELDRAHQQTRTFCVVVREIGALRSLPEIGTFLIHKFSRLIECEDMSLLVLGRNQNLMFVLTAGGSKVVQKSNVVDEIYAVLSTCTEPGFLKEPLSYPSLIPEMGNGNTAQMVFPFRHENDLLGGLVVNCSRDCSQEKMEIVSLILSQAAGVILRAEIQEEEMREFRDRLEETPGFLGMAGKDPKMHVIYKLLEDTAPTDATVLVQGESGTGKELIALAIHTLSHRKDNPFVVINCSAYPSDLLESELFGHEKGAFTGAMRQKRGRFEQADGGTVFLDEIGEISSSAQIKLLRVLQTRKFERVGGEQTQSVDVRVVAATNRDLLSEVKAGRFREDLYYRINVIPIHLPPLKERQNDVPLLARYFLKRFSLEQGKNIQGFSPDAMRCLLEYPWPGNVRELENSVEHATVLAKIDRIEVTDLPAALLPADKGLSQPSKTRSGTLAERESHLLQETLEECGWNKKEVARILGISRNTLYVKLKKYGIDAPTTH